MFENAHSHAVAARAVVVIGASAGGVHATLDLLGSLPGDFPAPLVLAQHLAPAAEHRSELAPLLQARTSLRVKWAEQGEVIRPGCLYVAPQDRDIRLTPWFSLRLLPPAGRCRPCVDRLFESAAAAAGPHAVAVVLSGCLDDGMRGARAISAAGGSVVVQDPLTSESFEMPGQALEAAGALVLPPARIGATLEGLLGHGAGRWFGVRADSPYVRSLPHSR
jgi:two-component system chemotaxis response regulator CheB